MLSQKRRKKHNKSSCLSKLLVIFKNPKSPNDNNFDKHVLYTYKKNKKTSKDCPRVCVCVYTQHSDEPSSQGLSLNRSQYGDCSTNYNTPAGT